MTTYPLRLDDAIIRLAKGRGFNPSAVVVRSAIGLPVATGLTQAEYDAAVRDTLSLSALAVIEDDELPAAA